jgi:hypothetical protein
MQMSQTTTGSTSARRRWWIVYAIVGGLLLLWGMGYLFGVIRQVLSGEFTFV